MTVADSNINVTVRIGLEGLEGRRNDVISVGEGTEGGKLVVYFGGDSPSFSISSNATPPFIAKIQGLTGPGKISL